MNFLKQKKINKVEIKHPIIALTSQPVASLQQYFYIKHTHIVKENSLFFVSIESIYRAAMRRKQKRSEKTAISFLVSDDR